MQTIRLGGMALLVPCNINSPAISTQHGCCLLPSPSSLFKSQFLLPAVSPMLHSRPPLPMASSRSVGYDPKGFKKGFGRTQSSRERSRFRDRAEVVDTWPARWPDDGGRRGQWEQVGRSRRVSEEEMAAARAEYPDIFGGESQEAAMGHLLEVLMEDRFLSTEEAVSRKEQRLERDEEMLRWLKKRRVKSKIRQRHESRGRSSEEVMGEMAAEEAAVEAFSIPGNTRGGMNTRHVPAELELELFEEWARETRSRFAEGKRGVSAGRARQAEQVLEMMRGELLGRSGREGRRRWEEESARRGEGKGDPDMKMSEAGSPVGPDFVQERRRVQGTEWEQKRGQGWRGKKEEQQMGMVVGHDLREDEKSMVHNAEHETWHAERGSSSSVLQGTASTPSSLYSPSSTSSSSSSSLSFPSMAASSLPSTFSPPIQPLLEVVGNPRGSTVTVGHGGFSAHDWLHHGPHAMLPAAALPSFAKSTTLLSQQQRSAFQPSPRSGPYSEAGRGGRGGGGGGSGGERDSFLREQRRGSSSAWDGRQGSLNLDTSRRSSGNWGRSSSRVWAKKGETAESNSDEQSISSLSSSLSPSSPSSSSMTQTLLFTDSTSSPTSILLPPSSTASPPPSLPPQPLSGPLASAPLRPKLIKRGKPFPDGLHGPVGLVALMDKPKGCSSFAICKKLRYELKVQKVGHAGTLDPMATGLLVVCLGKATKLADSYQAMTKVYSGRMRLGEGTPSYDADTAVNVRSEWRHVGDGEIADAVHGFLGDILQVPPMFSAIKMKGERLYEKARRGEMIEPPPRAIRIFELQVWRSEDDEQELEFKVVCSKGTYVRSLCWDLARKLGTHAHLTALRREAIGDFWVDDALSVEEVVELFRLKQREGEEQVRVLNEVIIRH